MALRAFPVIYARDVEAVAGFYARLGFREGFRMAADDGTAGFIRLERDGAELGVTTEESPRMLAGVEPGPGPRHELFVYVVDVDATVAGLRGPARRSCASRRTYSGESAWHTSQTRKATW